VSFQPESDRRKASVPPCSLPCCARLRVGPFAPHPLRCARRSTRCVGDVTRDASGGGSEPQDAGARTLPAASRPKPSKLRVLGKPRPTPDSWGRRGRSRGRPKNPDVANLRPTWIQVGHEPAARWPLGTPPRNARWVTSRRPSESDKARRQWATVSIGSDLSCHSLLVRPERPRDQQGRSPPR